ncbi:MAG: hypothetical protein C4518_14290 [Desulfobacteraceae bacterium]|nr:MAG: hypothetical protein C4518_14290 [Desulfobacteraceae bacterium]
MSVAGIFIPLRCGPDLLASVEEGGKLFERLNFENLDAFDKCFRTNHSRHIDLPASFCPRHGSQMVRGFSAAQGGLLLLLFLPVKKSKEKHKPRDIVSI